MVIYDAVVLLLMTAVKTLQDEMIEVSELVGGVKKLAKERFE